MANRWLPCKRREFIRRLRTLGFAGPSAGGAHEFMTYGQYNLPIPSNDEYSVPQLREMIREIEVITGREISLQDWEALRRR